MDMKIRFALIYFMLMIFSASCLSKVFFAREYEEEILLNNTFSVYVGVTENFVITLNDMAEAQRVSIYLNVNSGIVKFKLYNSRGRKISPVSKEMGSLVTFIIPENGNYKLKLKARRASFTFSVLTNTFTNELPKGVGL